MVGSCYLTCRLIPSNKGFAILLARKLEGREKMDDKSLFIIDEIEINKLFIYSFTRWTAYIRLVYYIDNDKYFNFLF